MRESIYFPVMISSPIYAPSFFENLANAIMKFKTPEGVDVQWVYNASDQLTDHISKMVRMKNENEDEPNPEIVDENISLIEIVFETDHSLIYQRLPWLEEQILDYVRGYYTSVVLYLFYLGDGGETFHSLNIAKVYKDDDTVVVDESPIEDDMSPLYELSGFLNAFWYEASGEVFYEKFPDLTAKFFLLF